MQKKKLKAEINKEKRNARTKRLIELGALVESLIGLEIDTPFRKELLKANLQNNFINNMSLAEYLQNQILEVESYKTESFEPISMENDW